MKFPYGTERLVAFKDDDGSRKVTVVPFTHGESAADHGPCSPPRPTPEGGRDPGNANQRC